MNYQIFHLKLMKRIHLWRLLGELEVVKVVYYQQFWVKFDNRRECGTVSVHGSISYASQKCWIYSASVRDNIIFESEFDINWYDKVIKHAFTDDLREFPESDETIIGERGINLSGGQRGL